MTMLVGPTAKPLNGGYVGVTDGPEKWVRICDEPLILETRHPYDVASGDSLSRMNRYSNYVELQPPIGITHF
jgi:hypothetical protein